MLALGIDAGGTATRAQAILGDRVVHDGRGGPGNPLMVERRALQEHYDAALAGCPEPTVVAACVAGSRDPRAGGSVELLLRNRFPRARVRVLPDYTAAWAAAPNGVDAVVVAGTGSVVCSREDDGEFRVSGGLGWMIGDHGSAARLGRALLDWHAGPDPLPDSAVDTLHEIYGTAEPRPLARRLAAAVAPAAELARAAPVLTALAAAGHARAGQLVAGQMRQLAVTTADHLGGIGGVVGLAGGVWSSPVCRDAFAAALAPGLSTTLVSRPPVEGALRLALETA